MLKKLLAQSFLALLPLAAAAAPQTVVLEVQHMTCNVCQATVRKALEKVPGVSKAQVDVAAGTATVSFDDRKTNPAVLVKATGDAGFPSKPSSR